MLERFRRRSRVANVWPGNGHHNEQTQDRGGTAVAEREPQDRRLDERQEGATEVQERPREQEHEREHHHGKGKAAVAAAGGAAVAEHEHRKHERERDREVTGDRRDTEREPVRGHEDDGHRHGHGKAKAAAVAGGAAVAEHEHRKHERERARGERDGLAREGGVVHDPGAVHARQREQFGGMSWGAAFFGFLVAVGLAVILVAIASAAGAAFGLSKSDVEGGSADTIGIVSGAILLAILALSYYAGGYVAGRMSRFDGGRQGFATWIVGILLTLAAAAAGAILGSEYNVFNGLDLPNVPIDKGTLTTGGAIALAAAVVVTLLAAVLGGKAGTRFHRRVDRAGFAE
jgi:hypothetical protein